MASTEQRTGFRLPWGSPSTTETETPAAPADHPAEVTSATSVEQETGTMGMTAAENEARTGDRETFAVDEAARPTPADQSDAAPEAAEGPGVTGAAMAPEPHEPEKASVEIDPWTARPVDRAPVVPAPPATPAPATPAPTSAPATRQAAERPPSRFLADLVRAMRSTAEENRNGLLDGLRAEGKIAVEQIHARSAEEVDGLRRVADGDVAGIKEWSKAEIARIRTETEERIAERRQELELSLEGHAALVEREIEHVEARIAEYEAEMDAFFVRLDEIDDPSEYASVAAEMPEPPSLEEASAAARAAALEELIRETAAARVEAAPVADVSTPEETAATPVDALPAPAEHVGEPFVPTPPSEPVTATQVEAVSAPEPEHGEPIVEPTEPESVAAPEADQVVAASVATVVETTQTTAMDEAMVGEPSDGDPRLAALGLTADAPEPEFAVDEHRIDPMSEATIAARLGDPSPNGQSAPESTTSVVVIGLVSVASVAAFKRTLGKVPGVRSVGVSSGPEGEFVFKTSHDADVTLKDVIPTLPGFGARVVAAGDGIINVSARDPETES